MLNAANITKFEKQENFSEKKLSVQKNLIYDVGMHQGQDTDYYLKKGFNVVAFEANPANVEFCKKRFSVEIEQGKLIIIEGAIAESSTSKKVRFYQQQRSFFLGKYLRRLRLSQRSSRNIE